MVIGWRSYEESYTAEVRYKYLKLHWTTHLRWLFTALILVLAVVGYFTVLARLSGKVMQPIGSTPEYEQVTEPLYHLK